MKNLSKKELKNIFGGYASAEDELSGECSGSCNYDWYDYQGKKHTTTGTCKKCQQPWCQGQCYCSNGVGICY